MKRLPFFCLLILFSSLSKAQFLQMAEGPVFPDPVPGISRILQLKNGNTMFVHINPDTAWNIHVYDAKYKAKTETNIEPAFGKLKAGNVEGIFEINADAVILISDKDENAILLYRLIIDGVTGKLKEEKQIAALRLNPVKKADQKTALAQPELHVRKDPNSENYAVAITSGLASDSSKRIEIILYGSDNKEINRAFNTTSVEKYKYLKYVDMVVIGPGQVAAVLYGYNIKDRDDNEAALFFATLDKAAKTVAVKEMDFSNDLAIERGITRYDPQSKRILMLTTAKVFSESGKLNAYLGFIDPSTKTLLTNTIVPGEKLNNKYAEVFGKGPGYAGIPQDMFINDNGTVTILFEEMEVLKEKNAAGQSIRNMAVATYDNEVELKSSYFIPMDHYIADITLQSFYQSERETAGQQFLKDNQYRSGLYISDGHNSFVILNDSELNAQATSKGKVTRFKETKDADAFYYLLAGTGTVPSGQYVFGKPTGNHKTGVFSVFDYDRANNVLVTLKTEKEGAHPGVKLVWLQP
ncbi:MAG: hypothetical protein ABI741_10325 [Ferruginibacter sp.]